MSEQTKPREPREWRRCLCGFKNEPMSFECFNCGGRTLVTERSAFDVQDLEIEKLKRQVFALERGREEMLTASAPMDYEQLKAEAKYNQQVADDAYEANLSLQSLVEKLKKAISEMVRFHYDGCRCRGCVVLTEDAKLESESGE